MDTEKSRFDDLIFAALENLSPAEQRVARLFVERKEAILLGSAAEIGALVGTSDATVVRTAQSLGFESMAALRQLALEDLTGRPTPDARLRRTLDEAGEDGAHALKHVIEVHEATLEVLKTPDFQAIFTQAVDPLLSARRRQIFGIGPTATLAKYAALQFNRISLTSTTLSVTGIGLADRLLELDAEDIVLMIAYAPIYREVTVTLDHAARVGCPVLLISDSLGTHVRGQVSAVLPVPRGKAGLVSLHAGTMVVLEALIVALAAHTRAKSLATLERLVALRGAIDKTWLRRGEKTSSKAGKK